LELAQFRINELPAGEYVIGEIYGEFWDSVPNHTGLGPIFKAAVERGRLHGIEWVERKTNNNQLYRIVAAPK
jgi:hypothetical protein